MAPEKRSYDDYSVGWICALPKEQTAATAMLDERHPDLPKPMNDTNTYTLGSIGSHNVVIACLPKGQYGTNSASNVATLMIRSFPSIKIGLMVGIGGGVPPKVRLGDVVISTPSGQHPGVIQWDLGKATEGGTFERTGALSNPPSSLLTALAKLETEHELTGSKIPGYLEELKEKFPRLAKKYLKSDYLQDVLFRADYPHVNEPFMNTEGPTGGAAEPSQEEVEKGSEEEYEEPCPFCDKNNIIQKKRRSMRVHHGLIASGNKVIKDGLYRDKLNTALGGNVLCFEMEAAGLMNSFPCLVIRGICDYCDSHKNKQWQEYAAAVAAAFAKELLGCIQPSAIESEQLIREMIREMKQDNENPLDVGKHLENRCDEGEFENQQETLDWLSRLDFYPQQHEFFRRCERDTGQEFINSGEVQNWILTSKQTLFSQGIPGAGKTFQMAILVNYLVEKFQWDCTIGIAYLYYNFKRHDDQKPEQMLASLIKQLARFPGHFPDEVHQLRYRHEPKKTYPLLSELSKTLSALIQSFSRTYILIDALDEGDDGDRTTFLREIFAVQEGTELNLFATSRAINSIAAGFKGSISKNISPTSHDISLFLNARMSHLPSFVADDEELQNEIKASVESGIGGMFLLAQLYIDSLAGKRSPEALKLALKDLYQASSTSDKSAVLNQAYDKSMERIQQQKGDLPTDGLLTLSWIIKAKRQLKLKELQVALAVDIDTSKLNTKNIPTIEHIIQSCASLVVVEGDTAKLVHYTAQEYFEQPGNKWMQKAHERIANICMTYLSFLYLEHALVCGPHYFASCIDENPLYSYSVEYWDYHVNEALTQGLEISRVIEFLTHGIEDTTKIPNGSWGKTPDSDYLSKWSEWCHCLLYGQLQLDFYELVADVVVDQLNPLHIAAFFGLRDVVAELLSWGINPEDKDSLSRSPISWAAWSGHARVVQLLLEKVTNLELGDDIHGWTPLMIAVRGGHESVVELLLDRCNINAKSSQGYTSLHMTAQLENKTVFDLLIKNGADIEARDNEGHTPLAVAAMEGRMNPVNWLLENGVDIESRDNTAQTPLMLATIMKHEDLVKCFIEAGADIDAMDYCKTTPLMQATIDKQEDLVRYFVEAGAEKEAANYSKKTPLMLATIIGHEDLVRYFVEKGADMEAMDHGEQTPLSLAIQDSSKRMLEIFFQNGIDINTDMRNKYTPLTLAIEKENFAMTKWLIEQGAHLDTIDGHTMTPLLTAIQKGDQNVVEFLVEKGADLEARKSDYGPTPLIFATTKNQRYVVEFLIQKGADLSAKDYDNGLNALLTATLEEYLDIIQLLIENGANIEARDQYGHTPLSLAVMEEKTKSISLLLANKANIEAKDINGYTPLSLAIMNEGSEWHTFSPPDRANNERLTPFTLLSLDDTDTANGDGCFQFLLAHKANIEARDNHGYTPLSIAAMDGKPNCIRLLLANKANLEARENDGYTPLGLAAIKGNTKCMQLLLDGNADTEAKDELGMTLLVRTICEGKSEVAKILLQNEANTNFRGPRGETLMHIAVNRRKLELINVLLAFETLEVDEKDNDGRTPLSHAAGRPNKAIVKALLDSGRVDVNAKDHQNRMPLLYAIDHRRESIVKTLLDSGKVDNCTKDNEGRTPLLYAIERSELLIFKMLLDSENIDVNAKDNEGHAPLHETIERKNLPITKMLLDCEKVDVNAKDNKGRTPLLCAIETQEPSIVEAFLDSRKADFNARDDKKRTPLRYAIEHKDESTIRTLLESGLVDINAKDIEGYTPLLYAIKREENSIIQLLFDKADINANTSDKKGRTPLSRAMGLGNTSIVKALLSFDEVDIEARDKKGRTPLSYAISCGVARVLLRTHKVDVNSKDNLGRTPLWHAVQAGNHPLIELLVRRGAYDESKARNIRRRAENVVRLVATSSGGLSLWQKIRASPVVTVLPSIVHNFLTWSSLR
ncbi:ankyrin repeat-containing domain protein [Trichoderma sp. SZMC 28015]